VAVKFLLVLLLVAAGTAFGLRTWSTKAGTPEANFAVAQGVVAERRQAALESQQTSQGYVIDPSLAGRMLRDSSLAVKTVEVRGLGPVKVARAALEVPTDGGSKPVVRYFKLAHTPPNDWKVVGAATALEWEVKVW
jgi:hypothetical protein